MRPMVAGSVSLLFLAASNSIPADELDDVVVTATRTSQSADETLESMTVITRAQIESRQARSIEDLLLGVEGLAIGNSGGSGRLTSFFVRGTDSDHLLVLVDGIKVGSATAGTVALQNLPLEQVERIEFVRGPRSSLYGSEAVGGVLQLFTRRGGGPLNANFSLSGGSYGTLQGAASLQGGGDHAWFSLQGSAQSIDGFDACTGSSTLFAGCFTEEPDDDAYKYNSVAVRGGYHFGTASQPGTQLEGSFWRAASKVDYDGSYTNRSEITQQVAGLTLTQPFKSGGKVTVRAGRAWDISDDFLDSAFMGNFETRRDTAGVQVDLPIARAQLLTLGVDYQDDNVSGSTPYDVTSRSDTGLFAQYTATTGSWRLEASARGDDNEQFGQHFTGSAAVGYQVSPSWGLVAQYGTAFRAPTFNELYYPFFGNPALDPEKSRSAEIAAKGQAMGQSSALHWRVSLFDTEIDDLIGFDSAFAPANIDKARIVGTELGGTLVVDAWTVDTGLTFLDPESRSAGFTQGNQLPRRPRFTGHLDVERRIQKWTLGARLAGEGSRYDDSANTRQLDGFTLLGLRAEYRIGTTWRVQARVENLFDTQYETVAFYNQPGRAAWLTLRYGK
jgi:vitamin B12 transporter